MASIDPQLTGPTNSTTQFPSSQHGAQEISAGEAILRMSVANRDEQLCCFVADMQTMRRAGIPAHAPINLTRSQAEAIEDLLGELGYSVFGKSLTGTKAA